MSIPGRLAPYLKPYIKRFGVAALAMLAVAALNGIGAYLLKPVVDGVFISKNYETLVLLIALLPTIFLVKLVAAYTQNYLMSYIGQRATQDIRQDLFSHLHRLGLDFFWKKRGGDILARATNDLANLQSCLQFIPLYLVRDTASLAVLISVLFYLQWRFAILALVGIPLLGLVLAILGKKMKQASKRSQEIMADLYQRFHESLQGMMIIKAFNYEEISIEKFRRENRLFFDQMMRFLRATALSGPLMEFLGSLVLTVIVLLAGREVIGGTMTPGDFFAFLGCFFAAYAPIKNLARMNADLQRGHVSARRIFELLDEKPSVVERRGAKAFSGLGNGLRIKNASFQYPGTESWALKSLTLTIAPGQIVGIAGPSGSGKTTLVHLILRLFDPSLGEILINGSDLRDYSVTSLRSRIGLVTQDTILFHDTVLNNVTLGNPDASRQEVVEACRLADAHDFIQQMPLRYGTIVGDRGVRLSGGQRQRLAIARAILKNPSLLLLDEATSNLDSASEMAVQKSLERLMPGRTVVMVAHRLSTVQNADCIFVLRQGELAESGTHSELLKSNGLYRLMYEAQRRSGVRS